jgi:ATP synthase alpha/beta family, beta-barrel domain
VRDVDESRDITFDPQYEVDGEKPPVIEIDLEACRFSSGMAEVYMGVNRNHIGHVAQVIGPVLDLQFEAGQLPEIYHAVRITRLRHSRTARCYR